MCKSLIYSIKFMKCIILSSEKKFKRLDNDDSMLSNCPHILLHCTELSICDMSIKCIVKKNCVKKCLIILVFFYV